VPTSVAAVVTLIPEGLILLVSITYAVASLGISRRGALAQQLNAIESLASVDLICLDKTGTLTETRSRVAGLLPAAGVTEKSLADVLGRYAASSHSRNGTIEALAEAYPETAVAVLAEVPFSSRWRFSGLEFADGAFVIGAPELFALGELGEPAGREARRGRRVLAIMGVPDGLDGIEPEQGPPADAQPLGLILLAEALREDARETVAFFVSQGVRLMVLSGDRPETVAAIASDVGLPQEGPPLDGTSLPEDDGELAAALTRSSVVGRISPEGKQRVVRTLTREGHYVAMVGDGVNDVPALKAARLAIAPGTGTQMARAVADLVLVTGSFAAVPSMVEQGRRILRNLQRVAKLFVTKSAFAAFLVLSIGLMPTAYPLLPRHLTLAAALTIGIPAFFLALAPSKGRFQTKGFLREVGEFAVPAGTAAGFAVLSSYLFGLNVLHLGVAQSRTLATSTLILVGLAYIVMLEATGRWRSRAVFALCLLLLAAYGLVLAAPVGRSFFALVVPLPQTIVVAVFGAAWALAGLAVTGERFRLARREPDGIDEPAGT
jgi:magnesium-transporting ATPase (P-type)